jgi:hypothetical protein
VEIDPAARPASKQRARALQDQVCKAYAAISYPLNVERIRVAPSSRTARVVRIEPRSSPTPYCAIIGALRQLLTRCSAVMRASARHRMADPARMPALDPARRMHARDGRRATSGKLYAICIHRAPLWRGRLGA